MRHLAALVLLTACASDPAPLPQCNPPGASVPCDCGGVEGRAFCGADQSLGACVCSDAGQADTGPVDTGSPVDVGSDAGQPVVDTGIDAGPADAGPRDTGAADVDPRQTEVCRGITAECDGRRVNVQGGERDGGRTYHCGACGVTCQMGYGCNACVCVRL